jgi:curli biogenesis system outer membrane secretion channel CsgG
MNIIVTVMGAVLFAILVGSATAADKPVMAVAEFTNSTSAGWWSTGTGWELSDLLSNELASTKAFNMVERKTLEAVLTEQNLAASGRVSPGSAAKIGKQTGAQYLITGSVSAYEEDVTDSGGGFSFGGFSLGGKKESAYLAIDLRVIDMTTGEIIDTRTVEGSSKGGGLKLGLSKWGFDGGLSQEKKTPAGKAIRAAIIESSNYLECSMVKKNRCMNEYEAKEQRRRDSSSDALELD